MIAPTHRLLPSALALLLLVGSARHADAQANTSETGATPPVPDTPTTPAEVAPASEDVTFDLARALVSQDRGFSADDAAKRARERSPQLAASRAAATSAEWDAKAQWSNFLPQLSAYAQYKRIKRIRNTGAFGTGAPNPELLDALMRVQDEQVVRAFSELSEGFAVDPGTFNAPVHNWSVGASAKVPVSELFLRVLPAYKAASQIAAAREVEIEVRQASIELQAREAFYGYARALATQLVAEQAVKQAEAQAAQAKLFVGAGTAAPVDFMTATARMESMRSSLARTRGVVAVARNTLATLTGAQPAEVEAIREPVTALPEPPATTVDEQLRRALDRRPELRALRKMVGANDQLKSAERNAALPTLALEGNVLHAQPNPRYFPPNRDQFRNSWELAATLAWSPNSAVLGYQRTQRASAELSKARADLAALEDAVRIEVVQAFEDYKAADAAARASEAQQRAAEETYRVRSATYRVGAGIQIDLLAADLALTQARLDYVNAVIDARTSLARLRRAVGEGS